MKRLPCRSLAAVVARAVLVLLLGVQVATRLLSREIPRQAPSSQAAGEKPTKTQRVANPLNDLLDEAQRSIDAHQFEAALAPLHLGILLIEKDAGAAVGPLRKAVELLPSQSRPRFLLGAAQERSGDLSEAAGSFEGALRLDPRDPEALSHLGSLY